MELSKNNWENQSRGYSSRFAPKWNEETILFIKSQIEQMVNFRDIEISLMQKYRISSRSAEHWIEMTRSIMTDMNNGLTLQEAIKRDTQRRTLKRKKTPLDSRCETE